jgi:hypothetical protein
MTLEALRERAMSMFRDALQNYGIPPGVRDRLIVGAGIEGEKAVFELYVADAEPIDATFIAKAWLNRDSGEGEVQVDEVQADRMLERIE